MSSWIVGEKLGASHGPGGASCLSWVDQLWSWRNEILLFQDRGRGLLMRARVRGSLVLAGMVAGADP